MKTPPFQAALALLIVIVMLASPPVEAATVWLSAPKPKFPATALSRGSEGHVIIRMHIGQDGRVTRAAIAKSSGDSTLDNAARTAVLKWKMNPAAIRPEYLTKGYEHRIDFRQEAPVAVRYRDSHAYFSNFREAKMWAHAPFPEYPDRERVLRTQGTAVVGMRIGADGGVASVVLLKSSGNANLDNAALAATRLWRAHRKYAGQHFALPVSFTLSGRR